MQSYSESLPTERVEAPVQSFLRHWSAAFTPLQLKIAQGSSSVRLRSDVGEWKRRERRAPMPERSPTSSMNRRFCAFLNIDGFFPLTPALSLRELRERGQHFQFWEKPGALNLRTRALQYSLSLRERAGVRGKSAHRIGCCSEHRMRTCFAPRLSFLGRSTSR